jgi:hypothetical protein
MKGTNRTPLKEHNLFCYVRVREIRGLDSFFAVERRELKLVLRRLR